MSGPTIRIPLSTLHEAIYQKLSQSLQPQEVFTFVPKEASFPFVVIGDFVLDSQRNKQAGLVDVIGTIYVYTKGPSMKPTEEISGVVVESLTGDPALDLSGAGFRLWDASFNAINTYREDDGSEPFQRFAITFKWRVEDQSA